MSKNNTINLPAVSTAIENLLRANAWKATKFISDRVIVRATRQMYHKKLSNVGNLEIILTFGKPNYEEREYVRQCKKVGEQFPLKWLLLKFPPKPQPKNKRK